MDPLGRQGSVPIQGYLNPHLYRMIYMGPAKSYGKDLELCPKFKFRNM